MPDADGYDLIDELPADGSREKEVFARFGLAAYKAQVFDHGLVNILCFGRGADGSISLDQIDALFARLFKKTSGALVNSAAKESRLGAEDLAVCRRAVDERNRLIHHFFRDHAEDFMTSKGQQQMLDDLAGVTKLLIEADMACHRVVLELGKAKGVTQEVIDQQYQEMLDQISKV